MSDDKDIMAEFRNVGGAEEKPSVPEKEEIVKMTKEELEKLIQGVKDSFAEQIKEATGPDKLRAVLEQNSMINEIKNAGEDRVGGKVKVLRNPATLANLKPLDRQQALAREHAEQLKGKVPRFVNNDADLRAMRRYQGYEPVLDSDGNEVRYVDGVLMAMPEKRYTEEIEGPRRARKALAEESRKSEFQERLQGVSDSVEVFGSGITYDDGGS